MNDLSSQPMFDLGDSRTGHAQLTNMSLALRTLLDCREAGNHAPRMGLFHGFSGYGKSVAAAFASARTGAIYIHAQSIWTQRTILETIGEELGITRLEKTGPKILKQIIDQLNMSPVDIIIDEMDHLVQKRSVEIIRDIHDNTRCAVLMIGEESLPSKLKEWERFDNRILVATAAQPASVDDALKLRDHYCTRIQIADDLVEQFRTRCRGITRRIVVNLQMAQRLAAEDGRDHINSAWWGNRAVITGDIQPRRKAGA